MPFHLWVVMELSSNGYGSPEVLLNQRSDIILSAYDYLKFKCKFEHQSYLLRERNADR
jgi:hypothetical protein